uniref:LOW QUALITY PROTEIN: protein NBR1 homolog n=1 Tax=Elaeis guineensis var. tenera TaxID=51953 RepID=A0A6I9RPQ6_ELAGV|nr:LOW QUALITY PROTEIN: protein NBR1 homolog [Elaeis guineensis]
MERPLEWDLVIKVKYGDTLKRFGAFVHGFGMDYDMSKLRSKIVNSFNLNSDAELILTYTDEDGDIVTLGDDDDLHDAVVSQHLNPLRINVQLKSGTGRHSDLESQTAKPTPEMSPQIKNQQTQINFALDEALKSLPEPFRGALSKVSQDFFLKAVSSAPAFAEFMEYFSKMGLSDAKQPSSSPLGDSSDTSIGASAQTMDVNIGDGPKFLNDSASLSTVIPDPVSEVMQKHRESDYVNSGGRVKIPVDLNTDIPRNAHTLVYPSVDDLLTPILTETQAPISATNDDINHDKETSDAHRKGKSIISAVPFSMPPVDHTAEHNSWNYELQNPFLAPYYGITEIMSSDNSKQLPVGMGSTASNHGFSSPVDVPTNKHISAPTTDVPLPSGFFPTGHPYRRGDGYHETMHRTFHRGVQCDGCGMHPIMGPRFKSNGKEDYDLCGICFSEMGNEADYTRIDRPSPICQRPYNDFYNTHSRYLLPSSHAVHGCWMRPSRAKLESHFVQDVTVLDGTPMPPSTPFTKIWRMCNNGTTRWPYGTNLVWVGGDQFANRCSVQLEIPVNGFPLDTEIDIAVDFRAPSRPGRYVSYWRLASPSGQMFGQRVWVLIQVDMSRLISSSSNFPTDLNLNLPPESSGQNELGIIDVNAQPLDGVGSEPILPTNTSELVKPLVTDIPSKTAEPAASDAIAEPVPAVSSSISYPLIKFPACLSDASPVAVVPPSETIHEDNLVEQTLLKKLEEMGFKQIDLNKEVLRLNDYNLEQSLDDLLDVKQIDLNKEVLRLKEYNLEQFVDDLCGSAEWDPLLADLQELGFSDNETNKKLLIKNGGSIKRVMSDLIAGEKGE